MKKKGFTLIELLAVIIILAVVALIATPVVLNIVEKVRIKAAESSAKGYAKAVEYEILNDTMFKGVNLDGEYDVIDNTIAVKYQGDGPSKGYFILSKNTVTYGEFCINGYPIKYENSIGKYAPDEIDCGGGIASNLPTGPIASDLCEGAINYDDVTNINIEKVEDLACISYLSNVEAKTFEGKTLSLISNIDFNDDNSYRNVTNTQIYKDMNGNGIEEDIKTEFTTSSGFKPIGNSNTHFSGIFEGYGYTISNLMINRKTIDGTGLFGYVTDGYIAGLNLQNFIISGRSMIGGIVGYLNKGTINEVNVNGSISSSSSYIGGVVGFNNSTENKITSVIVNIRATAGDCIGGIYGYSNGKPPTISGIVETGNLSAPYKGARITADINIVGKAYASNKFTGNTNSGTNGTSYNLGDNMLSAYDNVIDTWIGGDNDSSGYYFDYDENNKIVVKSVKIDPITFTLKGNGTESNPYLINDYKQWKEATTKVKQDVYFKLNTDLDFTDKPYYAMGTAGNYLVATLDGGYHKLSNITLNGLDYIGIVGYNNGGTIKGLNIYDSTISTANSYAGGVVGYNSSGNVIGINVDNIKISGASFLGGITGNLNNGIINEVSVNGSISSSSSYIGGVVGFNNSTENKITSVIVNISATAGDCIGGIYGYSNENPPTISGVVETGSLKAPYKGARITADKTIVGKAYASNKFGGNTNSGTNGTTYTFAPPTTVIDTGNTEIDSLSYYDSKGLLDTVIGGDNDSSGYYLDYNNSGDKIIVVPAGGISGGTGGNTNPDEPTDTPTIEIDSNYTMTNIVGTTDTEAPTCELYYVVPVSNGIRASFSCTDNSGAPIVRSLFDSTTEKSAATFDTIGTLKSGSVSGNTKTVISTWNVNNPISQPTPGTCYYFRYGGQDAQGNFSTYVTNICYRGFSN